jgi:undecaprenyl-diphosphatase
VIRDLGRIDAAVLELVLRHRTPALTRAARAVSKLAEPKIAYPLLLAAGVAGSPATGRARMIHVLRPALVVAVGAGLRRSVSCLIARPRPPRSNWLIQPDGFSLPSKHTTLAALTAGACADSLAQRTAVGGYVRAVAAGIVGTSRIVLGVHWPSDVLAGWLFAEGYFRLAGRLAHERHDLTAGRTYACNATCGRGRR